MMNDRLNDLDSKEVSPETYKNQEWAYLQAHFNGRKQELITILEILDPGV